MARLGAGKSAGYGLQSEQNGLCVEYVSTSIFYLFFSSTLTTDRGLTLQFDDRNVIQNDIGHVLFVDSSMRHRNLNGRGAFVGAGQVVVAETNHFSINARNETAAVYCETKKRSNLLLTNTS